MTGGHAEISVPAGSAHDSVDQRPKCAAHHAICRNAILSSSSNPDSGDEHQKIRPRVMPLREIYRTILRFQFSHDGNSYKAQAFTYRRHAHREMTAQQQYPPRVKRLLDGPAIPVMVRPGTSRCSYP